MEPLVFRGGFVYPGMLRIATPEDGSCFFHAICMAAHKKYHKKDEAGQRKIVRRLRLELATTLGQGEIYAQLAQGTLRLNADQMRPDRIEYNYPLERASLKQYAKHRYDVSERESPDYHLTTMQIILASHRTAIDHSYYEFISNELDLDIYVLLPEFQEVATISNDHLLIKNRMSVVILYQEGHYELVGLDQADRVKVRFAPTHPFIQAIRQRQQTLAAHS